MRRVIGLILAGLAASFLALAVTVGGSIVSRAAQAPAEEYQTFTLTASHASYLSPTRLREVTGAHIVVRDTITGSAYASDPAIAVWTESRSFYDTASRQALRPVSRTFAFSRATAELVSCCGENVNGNPEIQQSGIAGSVFPSGTRKQAYDVFDTTLDRPEPFAYAGTDTVDGIAVYRFAESISAARAGFSPLSQADPQLYSMHRTYWVDPVTGALVKISENEDLYLVNAATGGEVTHLFDADLSTPPATVADLVSQDLPGRNAIAVAKRTRLAVAGLGGALAAVAGILLSLGSGQRGVARPRHGTHRSPLGTFIAPGGT